MAILVYWSGHFETEELINVGPAFIPDYRVYISIGKYWQIFDPSPLYCWHLLWMDPNLGDLIKNQNKKNQVLCFFVFRNYLLFFSIWNRQMFDWNFWDRVWFTLKIWKLKEYLAVAEVQVHLFPDLLAFWFLEKIKIDFCKWDCFYDSTNKKNPATYTYIR